MTTATVTEISNTHVLVKAKDKPKADNISIALTITQPLYDKLILDSTLSKKSVSSMVEGWCDKFVSLQNVSIGLATLMQHNPVREKNNPDVALKAFYITISKRHYNLLRMEAIRQQTTIRSLLKKWIAENVKEWFYEQIEPEELQERIAA